MLRTIYGFDDLGRKVPTGSYDDGLKAVGGKIFYIDSNSDETVKFYDAQGNELSDVGVGDTPTYYKITSAGVSGKEKYYIFNPLKSDWLHWSYSGITTGADGLNIGDGKLNTSTVLGIIDTTQYADSSIWGWIQEQNTNMLGGNSDWFIGSMEEIYALMTSGVSDIVTSDFIWSSSERETYNTYAYRWGNIPREYTQKTAITMCYAIRSF